MRQLVNLWRDVVTYDLLPGETVQERSDFLVRERSVHRVDHYNPRHVPTLIGRTFFVPQSIGIQCGWKAGYYTVNLLVQRAERL